MYMWPFQLVLPVFSFHISSPWIWEGVGLSATLQSGRYTLSYPRARFLNIYRVDTIQTNSSHENTDTNTTRNIYGVATVTSLIAIVLYTFFFVLGSTTAGKRLHDSMLTRVVGAPLSFFETRSSGEFTLLTLICPSKWTISRRTE